MSIAALLLVAAINNPAIDMDGYLRVANEAAAYRQSHRVTEGEFLRMSREPGTIILDARSREKFELLHIKGAMNLSFPDISIGTLDELLPDKNARILIYCNNNFKNEETAFPGKAARASLNLSTYIALYSYGYRNVYELGPLLDVHQTKLPLEGSLLLARDQQQSRSVRQPGEETIDREQRAHERDEQL
ncbi:MAG TPA: rhodanese-like domain-containing protein [Thermoanaerobaculia bacterium]|nr:rhodanese-like domain-containing protein [Thermoanaerobaculia bacterium]